MFNKIRYFVIIGFLAITVLAGIWIPKANINFNATKYLPSDSRTIEALEEMEKEFGNKGSLLILFENIQADEMNLIKEKLLVTNVDSVTYRVKDNKVLYSLALKYDDYSKETSGVIKNLSETLDDFGYEYYMSGSAFVTYHYHKTINDQIPKLLALLLPIALLILFLLSKSYFEPLLFVVVIGVSVVLNMGTNAFLPSVSYLTHSICAIVQFAVCMDYSIILLNRYRDLRKDNPGMAMRKAWRSSLIPILSSGLTTVAGFIAIIFMKYKIGLDIGLVLAKGVVLSLIVTLFLLPVLILVFDKVLEKTKHKPIFEMIRNRICKHKKDKKFPKAFDTLIFRTRYIVPILVLIVIVFCFIVQRNNRFIYSDTALMNDVEVISKSREKIKQSFGYNQMAVVLVPKEVNTENLAKRILDLKTDGKKYTESIISYDRELSKEDLLEFANGNNLKAEDVDRVFHIINRDTDEQTISLHQLSELLNDLKGMDQKKTPEEMTEYLGKFSYVNSEEISRFYLLFKVDTLSVHELVNYLTEPLDEDTMKELLVEFVASADVEMLYQMSGKDKLSIREFIILADSMFSAEYTAEELAALLNGKATLEEINQFYLLMDKNRSTIRDFGMFFENLVSEAEIKAMIPMLDQTKVEQVFLLLESENLLDSEGKISIIGFVEFVLLQFDDFLSETERNALVSLKEKHTVFSSYLPLISQLESFSNSPLLLMDLSFPDLSMFDTEILRTMFIGNTYQRMIINVNLPEESNLSFTYFSDLETLVANQYSDYHIVSSTVAVSEIKETANLDYLLTSLLSIIMIFAIILVSFRVFAIPILLIILIQGAIYINMAIPAAFGEPMVFMGYIIVSCLQLGATIDYGILTTHRYQENRLTFSRRDCIEKAASESRNSILTSGLILTVAGLLLYAVSDLPVIAAMGRLIGFGGAISMLLVMFVLPQLLYLFDRFIIKKNY